MVCTRQADEHAIWTIKGSITGLVKVLMAASVFSFAAGVSAFVAPPPVQMYNHGNLITFNGAHAFSVVSKMIGKGQQTMWSLTATLFPGLPPAACL